jgi:hypothetical protein
MVSVSWPWCSKFAPKPESIVEPSGNIGAVRVTDLPRALCARKPLPMESNGMDPALAARWNLERQLQ